MKGDKGAEHFGSLVTLVLTGSSAAERPDPKTGRSALRYPASLSRLRNQNIKEVRARDPQPGGGDSM